MLHSRGNRAVVSLIRGEGTRPGNRFIWEVERAEQLLGYLDDQNLEPLRDHFVDAECLEAWARGDYQGFLVAREAIMNRFELTWFEGLHAKEFIDGSQRNPLQ